MSNLQSRELESINNHEKLSSFQTKPQEQSFSNFQSNQQGIYDKLNEQFSEQEKQQRNIQEARCILGESAQSLSDEQVYALMNEIQFLADTWLEEFEQKIFNGKTLQEILGSK